jgi:hypothetical protein
LDRLLLAASSVKVLLLVISMEITVAMGQSSPGTSFFHQFAFLVSVYRYLPTLSSSPDAFWLKLHKPGHS